METPRIVAIEGLRERLRAALGAGSLLFHRFDRALATRDTTRVAAAMDALALYPAEQRREVEDALLAWLLDGLDGRRLPRSTGSSTR